MHVSKETRKLPSEIVTLPDGRKILHIPNKPGWRTKSRGRKFPAYTNTRCRVCGGKVPRGRRYVCSTSCEQRLYEIIS